ncbi:MAG: FecR domain-containing protein [Mucilaginibacter sp.]|uniref:FecR family protein n=1 Tax=Mucilaginibacter sp. TaxID=1882438 RepID=UPI0031AD30F2
MEQQINKQFIQKYLDGKCSSSELQIMNRFLLREDAEQIIDQIWAEEWDRFQETEISDEEIGHWKDRFIKERMQGSLLPISEDQPARRFFALRYAAVWLTLLLSLGALYSVCFHKHNTETEAITMLERNNANGQRAQVRLSDNSVVYLAGGSKLIYPSRFAGNTREITLEGEAFFEIAKNHAKPFIIHTGAIRTRVVGTSFRINAFKHKPFLVEVATGKVSIEQQQAKSKATLAVLTPGQSMLWLHDHAELGKVNADDVAAWKNGRLVFNGATLKEMAAVFERWYNVKMIFDDPVKAEQHITITLNLNIPLSEIMEVLASTGKFQYEIRGRLITIN